MKINIDVKGTEILAETSAVNAADFFRRLEAVYSWELDQAGVMPEDDCGAEVSVSFVKSAEMAELNKRYRKINRATDVLSFPLWEEDAKFCPQGGWDMLPLGDIIVCPEKVAENAAAADGNFERELALVLSHGLLHLTGHDHDTDERKQKMWAIQEMMVKMFFAAEEISPAKCRSLIRAAKKAQLASYAPYSDFHVGAAILFDNGKTVSGCNVENASYGLSLCAERNAMTTAVSMGLTHPVAIAVTGGEGKCCPPCGACRQFLAEFNVGMRVILENGAGGYTVTELNELLPLTFSLKDEIKETKG